MTTLEKIRAEIENIKDFEVVNGGLYVREYDVVQIIDKYAEQEPCDDTVSRGVFEQVKWERDIAIEQLNELGYELGQKIEPCDDVVSRQTVLKIIDGWYEQNRDTENIEDLIVLITYMDSVRPQEPTGHWLYSGENGVDRWTCDNCFDFVKKPTKVCPNCGSRMKGGKA